MAHFPIPDDLASLTVPLWKDSAPFSQGTAPDDIPSLTLFLPEKAEAPAPALLLIPGGGYMEHGFDSAMIALAENFQQRGIATFLLRYRLASDHYHYPVPFLDAQRALRLIRHRAVKWNIDPARVALMGFSAGGHLGALLATHFDFGQPEATDPVERQGSRPDFAVLVYPLISLQLRVSSAADLLGSNPDPVLIRKLSAETQVTAQTSPTLLIHGLDDKIVEVRHSRLMFDALQKASVPSEFHAYERGKHGFGCWTHDPAPDGWLDRMHAWLDRRGFYKSSLKEIPSPSLLEFSNQSAIS